MITYLTPADYGQAELIEKKSRFIARVWPVENEEEALARLNETRQANREATHNVYAYSLREGNIMRYSDDGEPQGTSGVPVLSVFRNEEIVDFCCVVTRYFGGVLLGAGGLVRAYSKAAKMALDAAGVSRMAMWTRLEIPCRYNQFELVRGELDKVGAVTLDTQFSDFVTFVSLIRQDECDSFLTKLADVTAGTLQPRVGDGVFRGVKIR